MQNYRKLKPRLRRFAEAIVEGVKQTDAARLIKPNSRSPKRLGYRLRHDPVISAAIAELEAQAMESAGITSTRAWIEVARVAFFDHRKLLDGSGIPLPLHQVDDDTIAALAGIDVEELFAGRGEERAQIGTLKKYRAWNKVDALKLILQAKKELVDRHELTGKDGERLPASQQNVYIIQKAEAEAIRKDLDESV